MNPIEPSFPIFEYVEVLRVNGDGIETVKQLQATKQFTAYIADAPKPEVKKMGIRTLRDLIFG